MTEQLVIEPEARLLVELGQERGVVYEDEIAGLSLELDLDPEDVQALRDELVHLGVDITDPPAAEERIEWSTSRSRPPTASTCSCVRPGGIRC